MPPHCDSLDGPVVVAAASALDEAHVELVLPYVHPDGEAEVRDAFDLTLKVAAFGGEARDLARRWFFETVVRVHRAGEGAAYTGLRPAGLDVGPAIPVAERALASGSADELSRVLGEELREQVEQRLRLAMELKEAADGDVASVRRYVEAALGLQVWSHQVHRQVMAEPRDHFAR